MRKCLILAFLSLFIFACQGRRADENVLARVNDYEITKEEFEEEFKESMLGMDDTLKSRKEFLNQLINRKIILQEAQAQGLDKEQGFLKLIEKFWEQSLLKVALDRKGREISGSVHISDSEAEERYKKMQEEGRVDKPYEQVYTQIKWEIMRNKEAKAMSDWIAELHNRADVKINYGLLRKAK